MTTHQEGREYDIIFAGGGTAACIAAGRLAKADPNLSILLVEGDRNNHNDPTVVSPAIYLSHLAPGSQTALFYQANKEKALNDREAIVPSGGMLGGGSSINFMMYTRGRWAAQGLCPLSCTRTMLTLSSSGHRLRLVEDGRLGRQEPHSPSQEARNLPSRQPIHRQEPPRLRRPRQCVIWHAWP